MKASAAQPNWLCSQLVTQCSMSKGMSISCKVSTFKGRKKPPLKVIRARQAACMKALRKRVPKQSCIASYTRPSTFEVLELSAFLFQLHFSGFIGLTGR